MLYNFHFDNFSEKWSWEALVANVWRKWGKIDFFSKIIGFQ